MAAVPSYLIPLPTPRFRGDGRGPVRRRRPSGLGLNFGSVIGAAGAGSVIGPIGSAVGGAVSIFDSIFGGGSLMTQGEKNQMDQWAAAAKAGDAASEAMLRCMSKVGRPQDEALLQANPPQPPKSGNLPWLPADCFTHGWASTASQAYGKSLVTAIDAMRAAGTIGTGLIGQSTYPIQAAALFSSPLTLIALGVGAYLVFGRRRRGR